MITVISIRGRHSAVCTDDCGKSLTVPLDRLPSGTVVGSRVSLEMALGLPVTKPARNQSAERSGTSHGESTAGMGRAGYEYLTSSRELSDRAAANVRASTTTRRMTVVELRNRTEAVLVSETGVTMSRSIFGLPGRVRPGDVFLVASDRASRDPSSERWNDARRRESMEKAQQLRLHPVGSDLVNGGSSELVRPTTSTAHGVCVAGQRMAARDGDHVSQIEKAGARTCLPAVAPSVAELEGLRDGALAEIQKAGVALKQSQLEVVRADENTWTAFRAGTDKAAVAARQRLDASHAREVAAREKLRSSSARYRELQEQIDSRRSGLERARRLAEAQERERLRVTALAEDHRLHAEDSGNRRLLQSAPDRVPQGTAEREIRVKPAGVSREEARKLFGEN